MDGRLGLLESFFLLLLRMYGYLLRPLTVHYGGCRFIPTCSQYADQAIRRHGLLRGLGMSVQRLLRCHPLSPGGVDLP